MADNEIKNALERIIKCNEKQIASCEGCPLEKDYPHCDEKLEVICLDFINREDTRIAELEAEVEKLHKANERLMYNLKAVLEERTDHIEAIKEVFSRIESECVDTEGYFKYGPYLNLKCDMMKGR